MLIFIVEQKTTSGRYENIFIIFKENTSCIELRSSGNRRQGQNK